MKQLELHKKIDDILQNKPTDIKKEEIFSLISKNNDAKRYFFFRANENWLDWLWNNEFLDIIKTKPDDSTTYGYGTPEINYLTEMVIKIPEKVTQIILSDNTATTKEKFRPELIDQFLRMCDSLQANQLALVVSKIHEQKWVRLMSKFNHFGFEYEKMFKVLSDAKDYKSLLLLAETALDVREKEDLKKTSLGFSTDNPFYFNDLSYTKVFEYLENISDEYVEKALDLVIKTMTKIVLLSGKSDKEGIFPVQETYYLFDVDFFSLNLNQGNHFSSRDDVRELAAVIKILVDKLIGEHCAKNDDIKKIYNQYIESLPQSRTMWRLRLYVLSLCPESFKEELTKAFFKLFNKNVKNYTDIISGTEYEGALKRGFSVLTEEDKRKYVKNIIEYFSEREKKDPDQKWHIRYGSDLLSMIIDHLNKEEEKQIKDAGFTLNPDHKPEPSIIGPTMASTVISQGILTQDEFGKTPIIEIINKLKDEWAPSKLREKFGNADDFNRPHNAEGIGGQIQKDISVRCQEYVNNADKFFVRDIIHQQYLYSFLRGIEDFIKKDKSSAEKIDWKGLIKLFLNIKNSSEKKSFENKKEEIDFHDGWLSNWTTVHDAMTDVLQLLIKEDEGYKTIIDFKIYRDNLFTILSYLLKYLDPKPEDEEIKTATSTTDNQVTDPFTMAINSVRGRAFQGLMFFIYPDGRNSEDKNKVDIKKDVKDLYEEVLGRENTKALMFMFGHYLPSFYFRDIKWMQGLLPKIFPREVEKKYLYLAAWEGYLANNLYQEIFFSPNFQELYEYALSVDIDDSGRRYFRDPDQGIAVHFALAFVYYEKFDLNHPLFKAFWEKKDPELHSQFTSFIGRSFISGDNTDINEFLKKEPRGIQRIKEFWDWLLTNYNEPKPFTEFGFWFSFKKSIFEPVWLAEHIRKTLEKAKGVTTWDYGLTESVVELSKAAPKEMALVARLHFLEGQVKNPQKNFPFRVEREWIEAFKILYNNSDTKEEIYTLIDDLIREGGSSFWILKSVLNEEKKTE